MKIEQKCSQGDDPFKPRALGDYIGKMFLNGNEVVLVVAGYYDTAEHNVNVVNLTKDKVTDYCKRTTRVPSAWVELPNARLVLS